MGLTVSVGHFIDSLYQAIKRAFFFLGWEGGDGFCGRTSLSVAALSYPEKSAWRVLGRAAIFAFASLDYLVPIRAACGSFHLN